MTRLATAAALIVFAVYLVFAAPQPVFIAGAALMGILCYREYSNIVAAHGIHRPGFLGLLLGLGILLAPEHSLAMASLGLMAHFVWLLRRRNLREIAPEAACNLMGAFYAMSPWRFAVDLRNVSVHLLFFALALNWVGDSIAYYFGSKFGRNKLAPSISPGKSWEGAAASIIGTMIFGLIYLHLLVPRASYLAIIAMAVAGNIAGQSGDLVESSMKRGAGLKDSGSILPGHGGALDRLDSSLFTLPTVYLLSRIFNLF